MYGTIFKLKIKPGHHDALLKELSTTGDGRTNPAGMVAWFVMKPDDEKEWIGVAIFESKEAHAANANSPEQHQMFLRIMEHLESEPTWTDGAYVVGQIA